MTIKRVGGLTFVRIGRLQFSYCIVKKPNCGENELLSGHYKNAAQTSGLLTTEHALNLTLAAASFLVGFAAVYLPLSH